MEYLTLLEASKLIQDPLRAGIIEIFPRTSAVLERLPFYSISGNSYKYNQESVLPSIGFRSLNESYTADVGVLNPVTESLVILGGISQVDRALVKSKAASTVCEAYTIRRKQKRQVWSTPVAFSKVIPRQTRKSLTAFSED